MKYPSIIQGIFPYRICFYTQEFSYHLVVLDLEHSIETPTHAHVKTQCIMSIAWNTNIKVSILNLYLIESCRAIHYIKAKMTIVIWLPDLAYVVPSRSPFLAPSMSLYQ